MTLALHLLATAAATVSGFCFLSLLWRPLLGVRRWYEQAALSYLAGILLIALEIWVFGHLGFRVCAATLLPLQLVLPAVLAAVALAARWRVFSRGGFTWASLWRHNGWQWCFIGLIGAKLAWVAVMNLSDLRRTDDAFTIALSLAKHTYFEGTHSGFSLPALYPPFPGLVLAWFSLWRAEWNEFAMNLPHFNYVAAFAILFYANLRRTAGKTAGLIGVYVLLGFPLLLTHAVIVGYADLPMAVFLTGAGMYIYQYAREGGRANFVLAALFVLSLPAIKIEGKTSYLLVAAYCLAAAAAYRREWLNLRAIWAVTGGLVAGGILAVVILGGIFGDAGPGFVPSRIWAHVRPGNHLAEVWPALLKNFGYFYNNWMIVGTACPIALVALAIMLRRKCESILSIFCLLLLAAYVWQFCFGGAYEFLVSPTASNRSYLRILPIMLFAVVVMISCGFGQQKTTTLGASA